MLMVRLAGQIVGVIVLVSVAAGAALAQSPRTEHTFKLDDRANQPQAKISDVGWLVGSWTGSAFGGTFEEVWNPPSAGSMVGMFKVLKEDEVEFYELMLLVEEEGTLNIKVKHFNADFSAWEEKKEHVTFRLVKIEDEAIHFSGISFYRISADEIHAYLTMRDGDKVWEEKLVYHARKT